MQFAAAAIVEKLRAQPPKKRTPRMSLLHDIGTGDGVVQGNARGSEFRTPPLWVGMKHPCLHDGRARSIPAAVDAHHGQAQDVRDAFFALSVAEQPAIVKFLKR